jgi:hypothetical protein
MHDMPFNPLLLNPELTFSTQMNFQLTVDLVKYLASEDDSMDFNDILILELNEGIFIKTASVKWSETISKLADNQSEYKIFHLDARKWNDITSRYRSPLNSFGNEKLARWRVGF